MNSTFRIKELMRFLISRRNNIAKKNSSKEKRDRMKGIRI